MREEGREARVTGKLGPQAAMVLLAFAHESEVFYLPSAYVVAAGDAPTTDATRGASVPSGLTMNTS